MWIRGPFGAILAGLRIIQGALLNRLLMNSRSLFILTHSKSARNMVPGIPSGIERRNEKIITMKNQLVPHYEGSICAGARGEATGSAIIIRN